MKKPIKLTNSPVIQSVLSFIVKHTLGKPEVEEMISKQYDYIKGDPEAPNLRKDDFFLDGPKYKEGLIKHQVQPIYDLLIDKLTPGQLKKNC